MASATGIISLSLSFVNIAEDLRKLIRTIKGFEKRRADLEENITAITKVLEELAEVPKTDGNTCRRPVEELENIMGEIMTFLRELRDKSRFQKILKSGSIERKFDAFNTKLTSKQSIFQSHLEVATYSAVCKTQEEEKEEADVGKLPNNDKQTSENSEAFPPGGSLNPALDNSGNDSVAMDENGHEGPLTLQSTVGQDDLQNSDVEIDESGSSDQVSADEIMMNLADALTKEEDVEALGSALRIPQGQIELAKEENRGGLDSKGTLKMLQDCLGAQSKNEIYTLLRKAMTDAQLINKVRGIFQGTKPSSNINGRKMGAYGGGEFYDVFLLSNGIEADKNTIMEIANANKWRVITRNNFKLGEPVMKTIASVLESSSYVIVLATEKNWQDPERSITIEMSFQDEFMTPYTKIIPVRCCDKNDVSLYLKSKIAVAIDDPKLKEHLEEVITTSHREERERRYSGM